jgi:Fe-S cluster assembly iron-binding protein IscA
MELRISENAVAFLSEKMSESQKELYVRVYIKGKS